MTPPQQLESIIVMLNRFHTSHLTTEPHRLDPISKPCKNPVPTSRFSALELEEHTICQTRTMHQGVTSTMHSLLLGFGNLIKLDIHVLCPFELGDDAVCDMAVPRLQYLLLGWAARRVLPWPVVLS